MAIIKSGTTADLLSVDPTSKAARVTLYDALGTPLNSPDTFRGFYSVKVRQSAATGAGATVFAIWNGTAGKTINISSISLQLFFDGTAAATLMEYELLKATGVSAFSGGVVVTAAIKKGTLPPVSAVARILDTGLTLTGASFGAQIIDMAQGRVTQTTTNFASTLRPDNVFETPIELAFQEALVLRQVVTSVIGDRIMGCVEFSES